MAMIPRAWLKSSCSRLGEAVESVPFFIKMHAQFAQVKYGFIKTLSESEIIERSHQLPEIDIKSMAEWIGGAPTMVPP